MDDLEDTIERVNITNHELLDLAVDELYGTPVGSALTEIRQRGITDLAGGIVRGTTMLLAAVEIFRMAHASEDMVLDLVRDVYRSYQSKNTH